MNPSILIALMRRELWESPVAFKWTPVFIGGFCLLMLATVLALGAKLDYQFAFTLDSIRMFAAEDTAQRRMLLSGVLFSIAALFNFILFLVVVFYLAGSLFDDRKDRSILFWKSLPVSDTATVSSKLLTACLLAPALFLAGIVAVHILVLLVATVYALAAGVNPFTTFWLPASLPYMWSVLIGGYLVQALWMLPIYGWLLFCSSWAPRLPFLIAIAVPAMLGFVQHFWSLFTGFRLPDFNIWAASFGRIVHGVIPIGVQLQVNDNGNNGFTAHGPTGEPLLVSFAPLVERLGSLNLWIGVAVGLTFAAGAVWFRRRATDN